MTLSDYYMEKYATWYGQLSRGLLGEGGHTALKGAVSGVKGAQGFGGTMRALGTGAKETFKGMGLPRQAGTVAAGAGGLGFMAGHHNNQ